MPHVLVTQMDTTPFVALVVLDYSQTRIQAYGHALLLESHCTTIIDYYTTFY